MVVWSFQLVDWKSTPTNPWVIVKLETFVGQTQHPCRHRTNRGCLDRDNTTVGTLQWHRHRQSLQMTNNHCFHSPSNFYRRLQVASCPHNFLYKCPRWQLLSDKLWRKQNRSVSIGEICHRQQEEYFQADSQEKKSKIKERSKKKQKESAYLEVSMNNEVGFKVLHRSSHLEHEESGHSFRKTSVVVAIEDKL